LGAGVAATGRRLMVGRGRMGDGWRRVRRPGPCLTLVGRSPVPLLISLSPLPLLTLFGRERDGGCTDGHGVVAIRVKGLGPQIAQVVWQCHKFDCVIHACSSRMINGLPDSHFRSPHVDRVAGRHWGVAREARMKAEIVRLWIRKPAMAKKVRGRQMRRGGGFAASWLAARSRPIPPRQTQVDDKNPNPALRQRPVIRAFACSAAHGATTRRGKW